MGAFCLSVHAAYACRHSGACCTAGWPIPLEKPRVLALRDRGLFPHTLAGEASDGAGHDVVLPKTAGGACVFLDAAGDRLCSIQRDAGAALMPTSCRNFPRVSVRDPRGTFITLSHYCPTAAAMLLDAGNITIVEAPGSVSLNGEVEGLDATGVMPPLLRPGMLMDWDAYQAWEHEAVRTMNDRSCSARDAVDVVRRATSAIASWTPGRESLTSRVEREFAAARSGHTTSASTPGPLDHPCKAFLAAHLFASWAAHGMTGVTAVVDALEHAYELVAGSLDGRESFITAVRQADLRLRHLRTQLLT